MWEGYIGQRTKIKSVREASSPSINYSNEESSALIDLCWSAESPNWKLSNGWDLIGRINRRCCVMFKCSIIVKDTLEIYSQRGLKSESIEALDLTMYEGCLFLLLPINSFPFLFITGSNRIFQYLETTFCFRKKDKRNECISSKSENLIFVRKTNYFLQF